MYDKSSIHDYYQRIEPSLSKEYANYVDLINQLDLIKVMAPIEAGGVGCNLGAEMVLIKNLTNHDPQLGWCFLILAGTTARVLSLLPPKEFDTVMKMNRIPIIAMHDNGSNSEFSKHSSRLTLIKGKWLCATGVSSADYIILLGYHGHDLKAYCARKDEIIIDYNSISPLGLTETDTHGYSADLLVDSDRVFNYKHNISLRGGRQFLFRRAPVKHLAFSLGLIHSIIKETRKVYVNKIDSKFQIFDQLIEDLGSWELQEKLMLSYSEQKLDQIDNLLKIGQTPSDKQLDEIQALARLNTTFAFEIAGKSLLRYGSTLKSNSRLQRIYQVAATCMQHYGVALHSYKNYLNNEIL
jgi:hypothetical protein